MKLNQLDKSDSSAQIGSGSNEFVRIHQHSLLGLSDFELWEKFKSGDEASFIFIYKKYFPSLFQYGCQFTPSQALVEDAIQDLFIEVREKRRKISIKSSVKFYLFKSLKNKILYLIKKGNKNLSAINDSGYREFEVTFSIEQHLINSQIEKEQSLKLAESMKKLTPRQREAIYYFFYEDMGYKEIQELMNFTHIQAIRNLLYRALKELKTNFTALVTSLILFFCLK
ncbi:sigma-70 family RNA polymerase sigma factor [Reichenbachiella sp. MALMAid0571]|uniref:RNA polymerase sigma factor n=1 Tax=Reichenbachiella sp. MALMAid0571 TaxID=3143939 RepID=UPI0032DFAF86